MSEKFPTQFDRHNPFHRQLFKRYTALKRRVGKARNYEDVTLSHDWQRFTGFFYWMVGQEHCDLHLDKDILVPGNRMYGPQVCVLVPGYVNNIVSRSFETTPEMVERTLARYAKEPCFRTDVAEALTARAWDYRLRHAA